MAHVPIEDTMEHIDSKYRLVIVAAKRAKQLNRGAAALVQVRNVKPTYQALEEVATGKLGYEVEHLTGEATRELEPGGKPTWYRSLSAEEVVPEEVVVEAEERFEEEEVPVEAPMAGGAAEDLLMNEFEEEGLDELGDLEVIEKHKVSVFYTAPTAIRSLIKLGADLPKQHDLSSLRLLGTVGEPINPEAWMWYYTVVGQSRCPIVDTWWQTETGGHMITPLPGVHGLKPGSCTMALPGVMAAIVDEAGHEVEKGKGGFLVIKRPWPAMIRTIYGDPERYKKSYYPDDLGGKLYLAGDGANRDLDGYFWIMGRIDDVLNVSGHRLGTMEIESALVANSLVAEAAVVGKPHDIKGEAVVAFVVLKGHRPTGEEAKQVVAQLRDWVGKEIGPIAKPDEIRFGDNLPKTRSGKIMRRLLRAIAKGEEITQDVSTLENPAILEQLKQAVG